MNPQNREIAEALLKKLIYFDIFDYPLLPDEVISYCNYIGLDMERGMDVLEKLTKEKIINCDSGFYYLGNDKTKIKRRLDGNSLAGKKMKPAVKYSGIISKFPFVRGVFISGSLSKNFMRPDSDIDFFIVVEPGKLWLCRALLTIYKKTILINSHKNFCLNYFIDTNSLHIPDNNVFTATEIAFLIPMYNYRLYEEFLEANSWVMSEYPNMARRPDNIKIESSWLTNFFEYLLNNKVGERLDSFCFSFIFRFWQKKFNYMDPLSFSLNLRSQRNVSKHHPNGFQEKVLHAYTQKINQFFQNVGVQTPVTNNTSILNSEYAG